MKLDSSIIPVALASFAPLLVFLAVISWNRRQRKHIEKPPQTEKLLRPPGYSLSLQLEKHLETILMELLKAFFLGSMAGSFAFAVYRSLIAHTSVTWLIGYAVFLALFAAACAMATRQALVLFQEGRNIRLGISGEQAVAEALHEAAADGFRAFHDLQTEKVGNLDHVTVGTRGVFLIETKARRKRSAGNGLAAHEVSYDGEALQFPQGRDAKSIEQAKRNAAWLSDYLRDALGEPVKVFPLVVLPGWFVKKSERGNFRIEVMAAKFLPGFLARQPEQLDLPQVRRIIFALDKKCRDLEF